MAEPPEAGSSSKAQASVVDLTFALWALLAPLLAHDRLLNSDGDLARHLVLGDYILRHGPRFRDVFSFTRAGEPFLAYEWLSQVILALVHRLGGLPAVAVFAGVVIAAAVSLVVVYVRRQGGDPWLAYMTGALAAVLTGPHWLARPHLFSILALPILLILLDRPRPSFVSIALLFALWANLHPGFLYGLVMLGVICLGRLVEDVLSTGFRWRHWLRGAGLCAAGVGATLLNPFGWRLIAHSFTHAANSELVGAIQEFQPLDVASPYGFLVMGTVALVTLGLTAQRERVDLSALGAFLAGLFATVAARRNGPLLAVAGLPLMARALTPSVRRLPPWFAGRMRTVFATSDGSSRRASLVAVAVLVVVVLAGGHVGRLTLIPDRFSSERFPVEAVDRARAGGLSGRLLSEYAWGGYVLYAWPEQRLFIDSMVDFFGLDLLDRYVMMHEAGPDWRDLLQEYDISIALLDPSAPLVAMLRREPRWDVWYEDPTAVVLVRKGAG